MGVFRRLLPAVALAAAAAAQESEPAASGTYWYYAPEIALVRREPDGPRIVVARADRRTGSARPRGGVPVWLDVTTLRPGSATVEHTAFPATSVRNGSLLGRELDAAVPIPLVVEPGREAVRYRRRRLAARDRHGREISAIAGLVQGGEAYFGQAELRRGTASNVSHSVRVDQWAGARVREGYPMLQWVESVHSNGPNPTRTPELWHSGDMERSLHLFPRRDGEPARVVVRLTGVFQRPMPGILASRRVHVVCEFTRRDGRLAVAFAIGTPAKKPYHDAAQDTRHEPGWTRRAGTAAPIRMDWESSYQPLAPRRRGVRNLVAFVGLDLARGWQDGAWNGEAAPPRPLATRVRRGRLPLRERDLVWVTGVWRFDANRDLVAVTPLGPLGAREVYDAFRAYIARGSATGSVPIRRGVLRVVLEWAEQLPQRPSDERKEEAPRVARLLESLEDRWEE